ncbi:MAG: hypothetical protein ACI9GW_002463 [Halieaceae bacterium]
MNALFRFFLPGLLMTVSLLFGVTADAHNRSQSFSSWTVAGDRLEMVFTVKAREVTRLPPLEAEVLSLTSLLISHLKHNVGARTEQGVCPAIGLPNALPAAVGFVRVSWAFQCPTAAIWTIWNDSFFTAAASHVHYARIRMGDDLPVEYLFTASDRQHELTPPANRIEGFYRAFVQYTALGMTHIFGGLDHIAFLIALMLLLRTVREALWMVSGFTLGHSITLSAAALGMLAPDIHVIEALIGFTIALVAMENIGAATGTNRQLSYGVTAVLVTMALVSLGWGRGLPLLTTGGLILFTLAYLPLSGNQGNAARIRPLLTLAFGLIHGFGFANVLSEIGMPENQLITALAGFNIGVELGQVLIVGTVWYAAQLVRRFGPLQSYRVWLDTVSAGLCGLGMFWFVARSFSLA